MDQKMCMEMAYHAKALYDLAMQMKGESSSDNTDTEEMDIEDGTQIDNSGMPSFMDKSMGKSMDKTMGMGMGMGKSKMPMPPIKKNKILVVMGGK